VVENLAKRGISVRDTVQVPVAKLSSHVSRVVCKGCILCEPRTRGLLTNILLHVSQKGLLEFASVLIGERQIPNFITLKNSTIFHISVTSVRSLKLELEHADEPMEDCLPDNVQTIKCYLERISLE
jgi:hypothetical protein